MIKICKICGKEFEGTGTSSYCKGPHFKTCEVCGKKFEWDHKNPKKCCSRKCSAQLRKKSILSTVKVCELCGKEFHPKSNTQKYCEDDHFRPCPVCGKPVLVLVAHEEARCCSTECSNKLREATCISKYGVKVASQSDEVRAKLRDIALSEDVVQRRKATCLQNWGVDNPSKHPDVKTKISKTVNSDEYKNRVRNTKLQKLWLI